MAKVKKYIMPVLRTASAVAVFVTAAIRQAGPDGTPLTGSILFAGLVNMISGTKEIADVYSQPEKEDGANAHHIAEAPTPFSTPTRDIEAQTEESTHFRDMVEKSRSTSSERMM